MRRGDTSRSRGASPALALGLSLCLSFASGGCGRLGYVPARDLDGGAGDATTLDAAMPDAALPDALGIDALGIDATIDDAGLDAGASDATPRDDAPSPDAGTALRVLPAECTRGVLPMGVALPTIPPLPPRTESRIVAAVDAAALTAALSTALPGDVIELTAGAVYSGSFTVRTNRVTVRTRDFDTVVPSSRRVRPPGDVPSMARIVSATSSSPLAVRADDVSLVGLDIRTLAADSAPILHGEAGVRLVVDRCFVHGNATGNVRAGIQLDAPGAEIRRSWIEEVHSVSGPRPAVLLFASGGPITVLDSHLESAGEGVVLGTEMAPTVARSPHDVAICGNHFTRPLTWYPAHPSYMGIPWVPGPIVGIYNGQRVLVAGNELERAWAGGSGGRAFALGPGDFAPGGSATVTDVVLVWNHVRDVPEGLSLYAGDAGLSPLARVHVGQSLFEPIVLDRFDAVTGRILQLVDGPAGPASGVVLERITAPGAIQNGVVTDTAGSALAVRDSIVALGDFGFLGGSFEGVAGIAGLDHLVLIGSRPPARYGPTSTVVALDGVGFVAPATADWELSPTSPFLTASSTGGPAGCDVRTLRAVLAGVAP